MKKSEMSRVEKLIVELNNLTRDEQIAVAKFLMSAKFGIPLYTENEVQRVLRAAAEAYAKQRPSPILRAG